MALLFFDGFEQYDTALSAEYLRSASNPSWQNDGGGVSSTTRHGYGKSVLLSTATQTLDLGLGSTYTALVVGMATMGAGALSSGSLFHFWLGSVAQMTVKLDASRNVEVRRGSGSGTVLGTGSTPLSSGGWYYIECKVTFSQTVGTCEVKINGVTDINLTGLDNCFDASVGCNLLKFGHGVVVDNYVDDIYVCDQSGSAFNDFLGDVAVVTDMAAGAGSSTQWTPSAGSNWQNVDDAPSDNDTTYNTGTPASSHQDLYTINQSWPGTVDVGAVLAVQAGVLAKKTDVGEAGVEVTVKSGATTSAGSREAANSSYTYHRRLFETDPNGSAGWTKAAYKAIEIGPKAVV